MKDGPIGVKGLMPVKNGVSPSCGGHFHALRECFRVAAGLELREKTRKDFRVVVNKPSSGLYLDVSWRLALTSAWGIPRPTSPLKSKKYLVFATAPKKRISYT